MLPAWQVMLHHIFPEQVPFCNIGKDGMTYDALLPRPMQAFWPLLSRSGGKIVLGQSSCCLLARLLATALRGQEQACHQA